MAIILSTTNAQNQYHRINLCYILTPDWAELGNRERKQSVLHNKQGVLFIKQIKMKCIKWLHISILHISMNCEYCLSKKRAKICTAEIKYIKSVEGLQMAE